MSGEYYVYTHVRLDTGEVFYVGKGKGGRAWSRHSRNKHWINITNRHRWRVSINQEDMSEQNAYLLEMWLIAKLRHEGKRIANITDGGEGVSAPMPNLRKSVSCSNGMTFESVNSAAEWCGITASKISAVINGRRLTAGGFSWWLSGGKPSEYVCPRSRMSNSKRKKIYRSDGETFDSLIEASKSVSGSCANISKCAKGEILTAYGYNWSYDGFPEPVKPRYERAAESIGIPVECIDNGMKFMSSEDAARWVSSCSGSNTESGWPISRCAKGFQKTAYGFKWRYPE